MEVKIALDVDSGSMRIKYVSFKATSYISSYRCLFFSSPGCVSVLQKNKCIYRKNCVHGPWKRSTVMLRELKEKWLKTLVQPELGQHFYILSPLSTGSVLYKLATVTWHLIKPVKGTLGTSWMPPPKMLGRVEKEPGIVIDKKHDLTFPWKMCIKFKTSKKNWVVISWLFFGNT